MGVSGRPVRVGIIGLGVVGGGVARLMRRHRDAYRKALGAELSIARACNRHPERAASLGLDSDLVSDDWRTIVTDPDIDIVVELIGGEHPARDIIEKAIAGGKHVVSANKELLGQHMEPLAERAARAGVRLCCEAAAGGGIPIVNALEHGLAADGIVMVAGILNGTTNHILSRMTSEDLEFDEAVGEAQRLGYAEADPSADIDGADAAAKLAILSSIAFRTRVRTSDVAVRGIRDVGAADIAAAGALGQVIKLAGVARADACGIEASVHPVMIPAAHPLARVDGVSNGIVVVGEATGETMFTGAGAGAEPTASAVIADILALAAPIARGAAPQPEPEPYRRTRPMLAADLHPRRCFVRIVTKDRDADSEAIWRVFGERGIALSAISDVGGIDGHTTALLADATTAHAVRDALGALKDVGIEVRRTSIIPLEDTETWRGVSVSPVA